MDTMSKMAKYSMTQHVTSYIYDIIDRNDNTILEYIDEDDIKDVCNYALKMLEYMSKCEDKQEIIDFLFEGVLMFTIAKKMGDNIEQ